MKRNRQFVTLFLMLLLNGCAGHSDKKRSTDISHLASVKWQSEAYNLVDVPLVKDIFYLNEEKTQHFLQFYNASENQAIEGHKRLALYLDDFLSGFSYKGDTYNANVASIEQAGNCLSLAILTKAYASLVGLTVEYRKVHSAPVYFRGDGIITISSHVQTHILSPLKSRRGFYFAKVIIDYFPSSRGVLGEAVDEDDFVSMYYQNMAAKALMIKDFDLAYSLLAKAMQLSPENIETLNALAVVHRQNGMSNRAEFIYQYLLDHTKGSVNVLSNFVFLLKNSNRSKEAAVYGDRYTEIEDDNPYLLLDFANQAYTKKNYSKALYLFRKSASKAPYLPEIFFGQAKSYFQLGHVKQANKALKKASELAYTPTDKRLYLAKLHSLEPQQYEH